MVNTKISDLISASALTGTELFYADDAVNDVQVTGTQIKTFVLATPVSIGSNVILTDTNLSIGNSTANVFANSLLLTIRNATGTANLAPGTLTLGTSVVNSTTVALGSDMILSTTDIKVGNSTVNAFANSLLLSLSNATDVANLAPGTLTIGTSVVNSSAANVGALTVVTNTFSLGSHTDTANGYTHLSGGVIMQWGQVQANDTTGGDITFPVTFPTSVFSVQASPEGATYDSTYVVQVIASAAASANVRTANGTSISVNYIAIGI